MSFGRAAHARLATPRSSADPGASPPPSCALQQDTRSPSPRRAEDAGVAHAMRFIEEYETRKALVAVNRRPVSRGRRKPRPASAPDHQSSAKAAPPKAADAGAPRAPATRGQSRGRSRAAAKVAPPKAAEPAASRPGAKKGAKKAKAAPAAKAKAKAGGGKAAPAAPGRVRELEAEVDRLRRELKAEAADRLKWQQQAAKLARTAGSESSRSGSMQATVAKLRVQVDAARRREQEARSELAALQEERTGIRDRESEVSALRAQLADVRAQAEAERKDARAAQQALEERLRSSIITQGYRNSPDKYGEVTSMVDRRRSERDAGEVVSRSRRRSLPEVEIDDTASEGTRFDTASEADDDSEESDDAADASIDDGASHDAERVEELEQQLELQTARIAAERDEALQQLEQLGKVCHVLEGKVAEKDKRIQQLGQSTAAAERNAALQAKERELMAIQVRPSL